MWNDSDGLDPDPRENKKKEAKTDEKTNKKLSAEEVSAIKEFVENYVKYTVKKGSNYYNKNGNLIFNNPTGGTLFFVEVENGNIEFNDKKWKQGLSFQSLFGDENKSSKQKYTTEALMPDFFADINKWTTNSKGLAFGNGNLSRIYFWMESGPGTDFDYKRRGELGELANDYSEGIMINNNLIINKHEAGMFLWGYAASRAYSSDGKWTGYNRLAEDNKKMHLKIEGDEDEWGEVFAWTFGYMIGNQQEGSTFENLLSDVDKAMNIYYTGNPNYKQILYPYGAGVNDPKKNIWEKIVMATIVAF